MGINCLTEEKKKEFVIQLRRIREWASDYRKEDMWYILEKLEELQSQLCLEYFRNYGFR